MSLPVRVIDRLFERLAATYGQQWLSLWGAVPITDVKSLWAAELAGFTDRLEAIGHALEHLPERPPNLVQFKTLCRQAPTSDPVLPPPQGHADPARVQAIVATMRDQVREEGARAGLTPAQKVVDGLIARAQDRKLVPAQLAVLAACTATLRDGDPRLSHPLVAPQVQRSEPVGA